jgi:cell division protein ZipA
MDGLRLSLLLVGLVVVAGVYLYTRFQRTNTEDQTDQVVPAERVEPSLADTGAPELESADVSDADDEDIHLAVNSDADAAYEQKIVTLRVVARNDGAFPGDELLLSLRGIGMRHGKFGIFHRFEGNDENKVIFSAASLVEPGSFDIANIKDQEIPGISLFMVLPGPVDGAQGFDLMMAAARALAQSLNAELLDESGSTLSIQRERYLREEIIQHQHTSVLV